MSKVNHAKSPLFFSLESLETRLNKFSNGLDKFSNGLERLETLFEPRSSKFRESRIENRVLSIELREPVNLHLSGTVQIASLVQMALKIKILKFEFCVNFGFSGK